MIILAVLQLIVLHTLDGRDVYVNTSHIVSVVEARDEDDPHKHMTAKVHCAIGMLDGKIYTVAESCDGVRQRLQEIRP
jgi:uncharacterized protein YlzI (FlbEa/FlbD family)